MNESANLVDHELLLARANTDGDLSGFQEQIGEGLLLASEDGSGVYECRLKTVRDRPAGLEFIELTVEMDAELSRQIRAGEKTVTVQLKGRPL